MFGLGGIVVIVHMILMAIAFKFESPKYALFQMNNEDEAKKTICK